LPLHSGEVLGKPLSRPKKKQGEWYELTLADISAFKKRREFIFGEFFP
jgi:hypothetical protein